MAEARIRILHVIGTGGPGGVETFVANAVRAVDKNRFSFSVCIIAHGGAMADEIRALGVSVVILQAPRRLHPVGAYRLLRLIASGDFDIVHLHVGGRLLQYLLRTFHRGAMIAHLHGPASEDLGVLRGEYPMPASILGRILFSRPNRLLTCSNQIAAMLRAAAPQLNDCIKVLPYGIDTSRFKPTIPRSENSLAVRRELGLHATDFVAAFVGRLVPQKGIEHLVAITEQLVASVPAFRLFVIGGGPLASQLLSLASRLRNDRIILLDERTDVEHWLPACDVQLLTSQWEAFGIVLLEAMACARPVVAFAVDGVPEVVTHGESGLLVTPGDLPGFVAAVVHLAVNPNLRLRLGAEGRASVERRFTMQQTARRLESEYIAVLKYT